MPDDYEEEKKKVLASAFGAKRSAGEEPEAVPFIDTNTSARLPVLLTVLLAAAIVALLAVAVFLIA